VFSADAVVEANTIWDALAQAEGLRPREVVSIRRLDN
jgi:hypothetical protein